jgi:beta-lactamase regulating signal transducer with metallopeptidase domain
MICLIVEAVVRSMALGACLWIALALSRSRNPHLHKMLWSVVLLASLTIPFVMRAHVVAPVIPAPDYVLTLRATGSASSHWSPVWSSASGIYVLVVLALLLRYARSLVRMWSIRSAALVLREDWTTGLHVRVTTRITGPATFGSTILLPAQFAEWSSQKLHAVIAHERAHVVHLDCYVLWLARLYTCLFWINPLAWWLQQRLAGLAETTSDEAAVIALGDRPGYAEILLEFAGQRVASDVATAMGRPNISSRIERILAGITPATTPGLAKRMVVLAALVPAVAATAAPLGSPVQLTPAAIKVPLGFAGMEKYYPKDALRRGIDGLVQIQVTLDAKGRATDTLVLSEDPLDMGFGAAASTLAHVFEYDNPGGRQAQLTFDVKFELKHDESHFGTTDFEHPEGQ